MTVAPHLDRLGGESRFTGSDGAARAREYCRGVLADLGLAVTEHSFEYSQFPGMWATPAAGLTFAVLATLLVRVGDGLPRLTVGLLLLVCASTFYVVGLGHFPFFRARGVNLEAVRAGVEPKLWLVAHVDSKSQPAPMALRVIGIVGSSIALIAVAVLIFVRPSAADFWLGFLWATTIPLLMSTVSDRNHGSLDNASGVATVLHAIERLPRDAQIGVLLTDAEELGLAGAREWARAKRHATGVAINVDSVDDVGPLVVMYSGRPPAPLVSAFKSAASSEGEPIRVLRLLPGILTDHVALGAAGWRTLTLSRGTSRTLGRIHSRHDTLAYMDGGGIVGAAKVLARTASELI